MLKLLLPLVLFYVANGLRGTCQNMTNPLCQKAMFKYFNYTVDDFHGMRYLHALITEERVACKLAGECPTVIPSVTGAKVACAGGRICNPNDNTQCWDCNNVDLHAFVSLSDLGSSSNADGNDIWGYTNSAGEMFAITGQTDGASIVYIPTENPSEPEVLCFIPSRVSTLTTWRDMKVVDNYAYIVADRSNQGLQYINLDTAIAKCRGQSSRPLRLVEGVDFNWVGSGVYVGGTNTHNIVTSQDPNKKEVYIVGSSSCSGGLMTVDVSGVPGGNPPFRTGCFSGDGYTHDAECVTYAGPDTRYTGRNICIGYNENSVTIVDMTNPGDPDILNRMTYTGSAYCHQGWITDNHEYLLMNDELDEQRGNTPSQSTFIVNIKSLTNPSWERWLSGISSIDHNNYIRGNYVYQANYKAGLRILDIRNIDSTGSTQSKLSQTGFFKTYIPATVNFQFDGAWSVYPFFQSGENQPNVIVVQDINTGLYILDPTNSVSL